MDSEELGPSMRPWILGWLVLFALVLSFGAFSVQLVMRVADLRDEVETNVTTLLALQDLPAGPEAAVVLDRVRQDVAGTSLERSIETVAASLDGPDREVVIRAYSAEVRRANARLSQELGTAWDQSTLLIFSALGFALLALILGGIAVRIQLSNRRLAADIAEKQVRLETADVLHALNGELAEARDEALAAQRVKNRLLQVLGHELRTPLTAILGYAALIEDDEAHTTPIIKSAERLTRRAAQILDLSEDDSPPLPREALDLSEFLAPYAEHFAATLHGRAVVNTQSDRLGRVMEEILSNAAHYGETVRVLLAMDNGQVRIEVTDDGRGMAPEEVERSVEPFWQADMSPTRTKLGLGLGLAVAHHHVKRLGGKLEIRSQPGHGTTVAVLLPA